MISTLIQLHAEYVMDKLNETKGTITWINISTPPEKLSNSNTSALVLVYDPETKLANTDFYMHDRKQFFAYKNATHWAILNTP